MSDNLTLGTFIEQLYGVQFVDNTPREAHLARRKVVKIVQHLWELLEASQRALARAMAENAVHSECLEMAMEGLRACELTPECPYSAEDRLDRMQAKLAELETAWNCDVQHVSDTDELEET